MRKLLRPLIVLLLLVALLPEQSQVRAQGFHKDDLVTTNSTVSVHEQPTAASRVVAVHSAGVELRIINDSPKTAEGETWWQIETLTATSSGWVVEDRIDLSQAVESQDATGSLAEACWDVSDVLESATGAPGWSVAPRMVIDPAMNYVALLETSEGEILIQLFAAEAPEAVNNFVCLASAGYYDGTAFHRVVADAFIQGGDATGTGDGGPGYTFAAESEKPGYPEGAVALANAGPGTNGSQFFIAASDLTDQIPDDFPVFGQVVDGIYLVEGISRAQVYVNERGESSEPAMPIVIDRVTISAFGPQIGPILAVIDAPVAAQPETPVDEATPAAPAEGVEAEFTLAALELYFEPHEFSLPAGQLVTLEIVNDGVALHNFSIDELAVSVDLAPGETKQVTLISAAGSYEFYCNVPGHKEAGMVGTITFGSGTGTSTTGTTSTATGCAGFEEYRDAYDGAVLSAVLAEPALFDLILRMPEDTTDSELMESLTPDDLILMGSFLTTAADELGKIAPPIYAQEWHDIELEIMRAFGAMMTTAGTDGIFVAGLQYSDQVEELTAKSSAARESAALACPEFAAWAATEGFLS